MPTLVGLWGYQRGVLRHRKGRWPAGPVLLPIVPCGWAEEALLRQEDCDLQVVRG